MQNVQCSSKKVRLLVLKQKLVFSKYITPYSSKNIKYNDGSGFTHMSNLVKQSRYKKLCKDIFSNLLYFKQHSVVYIRVS